MTPNMPLSHVYARLPELKKNQPSFAVEYKSGRRKPDAKPNSIWGNMDLKAVALDLEEEAMPFVSDSNITRPPAHELHEVKPDTAVPSLTVTLGRPTSVAVKEETTMADEINTITPDDAPAVAETPVVPKKERKPRAKRAIASVDTATEFAPPAKQRRGRKAKPTEEAAPAKRAPVKRTPKAEQTAPAVPVPASDEMADLLQLEEENQRLRTLLAEKLRAENADLRKRLKLD